MTLNHRNKLSKLSKLFRSKSEQGLKCSPSQSPSASPKNSPSGPPRRRLLRVIRDNESEGEEWENPHVIRRYSQRYWEKQNAEARALQHSVSLPYDVNTDQSILKKATSTESDNEAMSGTDPSSPTLNKKSASFKEEVEVIEFVYRERIAKHAHNIHAAKLGASDDEVFHSDNEIQVFKKSERKERMKEFQFAKQNSFEEDDEEVDSSEKSESVCSDSLLRDQDSDISHVSHETVSDSGAMSDESGCCSDTEEPKKKHKKRRLHFRVKFSDNSNDSDKENDAQPEQHQKPKSTSKLSKLLHRVHLDRERETNSSGPDEVLCRIDEH